MDDKAPSVADGYTSRRLQLLKIFLERIDKAVELGSLQWNESSPHLRSLTVNNCIRRQRDALEGAIALGQSGQGHLAVAFVRTFLEERMWITFLATMTPSEADALLLAMGRWDGVRGLKAQRDYIGDLDMTVDLWYPPGFVDAQVAMLPSIKSDLSQLRARWGWKGTLPSLEWVAKQVSLEAEYEYLHSATSRAVHFSAGEVLRRGWGVPGHELVTDKKEFREHLAEFAYDQLWRQHLETLLGAVDLLEESGISVSDDFFSEGNREQLIAELRGLGRVPLIHAHEWNLAPPPPGTRFMWTAVMLAKSASEDSGEADDASG